MKLKHIGPVDIPVELPDGEHTEATFQPHVFQQSRNVAHRAWVYGKPINGSLVRIHSECHFGDVFRAKNCDCRAQLDFAESEIIKAGRGIIIYMDGHEGRGAGIVNKVKALHVQQSTGLSTAKAYETLELPMDKRRYGAAVEIIKYFGLTAITLLTNNPAKIKPFEKAGIKVERRSCWVGENQHNRSYLNSKTEEMGHIEDPVYFGDPKHPLANFHAARIEIGDRVYDSIEHYYQAQKFIEHADIYEIVATAPTAQEAKDRSREHQSLVRSDWGAVKEEVMYRASVAKFTQHEDLRVILLATGSRPLIEDSPDDPYWGITPDGKGLNRMGVMLASARELFSITNEFSVR